MLLQMSYSWRELVEPQSCNNMIKFLSNYHNNNFGLGRISLCQTLVTSAMLSFIEKAFDQIYWRKVFQSLCLVCRFYVRNKSNHVKRNLSPMAALGPKRAGFRPNPSWVTLYLSHHTPLVGMHFIGNLDDIMACCNFKHV